MTFFEAFLKVWLNFLQLFFFLHRMCWSCLLPLGWEQVLGGVAEGRVGGRSWGLFFSNFLLVCCLVSLLGGHVQLWWLCRQVPFVFDHAGGVLFWHSLCTANRVLHACCLSLGVTAKVVISVPTCTQGYLYLI